MNQRSQIKKPAKGISNSLQWRYLNSAILLLALVLLLWSTLNQAFIATPINADSSFPVMVFLGWQHVGFKYFESVNFTVDNWLLSLFPIDFILFSLLGINVHTIILSGWLFFGISLISVAFLLSRKDRIAKFPTAIVAFCLVMLVQNVSSAYSFWYVFPVSHGISLMYCVTSVIIVIKCLEAKSWKTSISLAIILLLITLIAGLSDPWFIVAFDIPLLVALPIYAIWNMKLSWNMLLIVFGIVLGWLVGYSQLFGLMSFLPVAPYHFATSLNTIKINAISALQNTAGLLGLTTNAVNSFQYLLRLTIYILVLVLGLPGLFLIFVKLRKTNSTVLFAGIYFFVSSCAVFSSLVLSDIQVGQYTARYILNVPVFLLALLCLGVQQTCCILKS